VRIWQALRPASFCAARTIRASVRSRAPASENNLCPHWNGATAARRRRLAVDERQRQASSEEMIQRYQQGRRRRRQQRQDTGSNRANVIDEMENPPSSAARRAPCTPAGRAICETRDRLGLHLRRRLPGESQAAAAGRLWSWGRRRRAAVAAGEQLPDPRRARRPLCVARHPGGVSAARAPADKCVRPSSETTRAAARAARGQFVCSSGNGECRPPSRPSGPGAARPSRAADRRREGACLIVRFGSARRRWSSCSRLMSFARHRAVKRCSII
jgi:hypothetical protein